MKRISSVQPIPQWLTVPAGAVMAAAAIAAIHAIAQQSTLPMPSMPGGTESKPANDPFAIFASAPATETESIEYKVWGDFVSKLVLFESGRAEFAYRDIKQNATMFLNDFVGAMESLRPELLGKKEQLALWINLYNAQVVRETTRNYPVRSVEALVNGPAWADQTLGISGVKLSLNDIRSNVLARHFNDPRILSALFVPARGGPAVPRKAYSGPTIDAQLDAAAAQYINQGGVVTIKGDIAYLSPVFTLNRMFFGGEDARMIAHLKQFAKPKLAQKLALVTRVETGKFDWTLNDHIPRQSDFGLEDAPRPQQSSGS